MLHGISLAFVLGAAVAQGGPPPLAAKGEWSAGVVEGRCVATRGYGAPSGEVVLELSKTPTSLATTIRTVLPQALDPDTDITNITLRLLPEGRAQTFSTRPQAPFGAPRARPLYRLEVSTGVLGDGRVVRKFSIESAMAEALASAREISLAMGKSPPVRLAFDGGAAMLNTLDACERRLAAEWNVDLAARSRIAVAAEASSSEAWVTYTDYPAEAIRAGAHGTSLLLFFVEADGRVRDCRAIVSSGHRILDDVACALLRKRARYKPARDAAGVAQRQPIAHTITWELPDRRR